MRAATLVGSVGLLVTLATSATANGSPDCGLIRDPDRRRLCFALQDRRPGDCNLIRDGDQRRVCRAVVEQRR